MASTNYTYVSNLSRALREELSDVITNIAPTDTTFISNIGKGKCKTKYVEWLTDTLAAAAQNAKVEGVAASAAAVVAPTRPSNYTQISAKWFDISDTMEAVDSAGDLTGVSYQTAKALKELSRDIEYDCINTAAANAGGSTTARNACGLKGWITTTTYDFSAAENSSNLLTDSIFTARIQAAWVLGGQPDIVLAPAQQKKLISTFDQSDRQTVNVDAGAKKIVAVVDYYESDFGLVRIYPNRFIVADDTYYDWLFILQKDMWEYLTLLPVKVEKLARTGLFQLVQISTEWTLKCKQEKANAYIKYLYNA